MKKTAKGLVDFAKSKVGTPYVYGAKGEVMSLQDIQNLRARYGSAMVWPSDDKKAGSVCVDCSGLLSWYTGIQRGSAQYKETADECISINERSNDKIGWAVYMKGHIGVYLGNDEYIAADGSAYGVRIANLSCNHFTHLLKLCDIDYSDSVASDNKPAASAVNFYYAVRAGGKEWPEVHNLSDYAGVRGQAITDVKIRCDVGWVEYAVHVLNGGWLPAVTGCDWSDATNGYAGNHKSIDAVRVVYHAPDGSTQKAQYRVSALNKDYWAWQYNNEIGGGQDGYAGAFGHAIDRLQLF